jgi:hypothetical protein
MARFPSRTPFLERTESRFSAILLAVIATVLILVINWNSLSALNWEGTYYYALAQKGPQQIEKPYAGRFLHPLLARWIADITNLDLHKSFYILGLLSLLTLTIAVTWILKRLTRLPLLILPLLLSPASSQFISSFYHHDLFYAALLALLFLTLWQEKSWIPSFVILLALFLTRESTLLLSLCIIAVAWVKSKRKIIIPVVAASLLGLALTSYVTRSSPANVHQMDNLVYLALKIPFNFFQNVFGIKIWLNTFVKVEPPLFTVELPKWLHLGSISAVGLCPWLPIFPLTTLFLFLTSFGIGPLLMRDSLSKFRRRIFAEMPPWFLLFMTYGILSYLITPLLGSSLSRYIGYGWPAFWLAVPALAAKYYVLPKNAMFRLILLHILASWIPFAIYSMNTGSVPVVLSSAACAAVIQWLALREIRQLKPKDKNTGTGT